MAKNRFRVNYEGNERVDLPDFSTSMERIVADLEYLVKTFIDNSLAPKVLRRYEEGTHSSNTFKLKNDEVRAILDQNQKWAFINTDTIGSTTDLAVLSNTTNYIEVRIKENFSDLQTRAFWDTDIGDVGEEYFDEINTRITIDEEFNVNNTGFSGGDWIPLFEVVVDVAGTITSVTRADDFFWKNRSYSLPADANDRGDVYTDKSLNDLRTYIDFLGAIFGEIKGTGQTIESKPWSAVKLLREYENIVVHGGGVIRWEGIFGSDTLVWDADFNINIAGRSSTYVVDAGSGTLLDGECLYVIIPEGAPSGSLSASVDSISDLPINPTEAGHDPSIVVLFYRKGENIYGMVNLPDVIQYSSANIITQGSTLRDAVSELDAQVLNILNDLPEEEDFIVGAGGQSLFTATTMSWDALSSVVDILVFVNGKKQKQDTSGGLAEDFRKISATEIEFSYTIPENARVTIHSVRTGGGGGGATVSVDGAWKVEYHLVTSGEHTAKQFSMDETPTSPSNVLVDIMQGSGQRYEVDFTIVGNVFGWNGLGLDGVINVGDVVRLAYFYSI